MIIGYTWNIIVNDWEIIEVVVKYKVGFRKEDNHSKY